MNNRLLFTACHNNGIAARTEEGSTYAPAYAFRHAAHFSAAMPKQLRHAPFCRYAFAACRFYYFRHDACCRCFFHCFFAAFAAAPPLCRGCRLISPLPPDAPICLRDIGGCYYALSAVILALALYSVMALCYCAVRDSGARVATLITATDAVRNNSRR